MNHKEKPNSFFFLPSLPQNLNSIEHQFSNFFISGPTHIKLFKSTGDPRVSVSIDYIY